MSYKFEGIFSLSLKSAQLQLDTLFENCGGKDCMEFLDLLGALDESEQKLFLKAFKEVLTKVKLEHLELDSNSNIEFQEFEEDLYKSICSELDSEAKELEIKIENSNKVANLPRTGVIDLCEARKVRQVNL